MPLRKKTTHRVFVCRINTVGKLIDTLDEMATDPVYCNPLEITQEDAKELLPLLKAERAQHALLWTFLSNIPHGRVLIDQVRAATGNDLKPTED